MLRVAALEILAFLLPFALYAVYLLAKRRSVRARSEWLGALPWLVVAGGLVAIAALANLATDTVSDLHEPYKPATLDELRR